MTGSIDLVWNVAAVYMDSIIARRSLLDLVGYSRHIPGLHNSKEEFA
jgi:hypothetical protein